MLPLHMVDEATVERNLLTAGLPDPDLLIRTSGEKRVSRDRQGPECHGTICCVNRDKMGWASLEVVLRDIGR